MSKTIFGYFNAPEQTSPAFDPGLEVDCPICRQSLDRPMVTVSILPFADTERSYFYRCHKGCYAGADPKVISQIEGLVVDPVSHRRLN